jgi:NAD(P)-dependent dehydrogenase (short-subunit alcohol dehydrogenase family)
MNRLQDKHILITGASQGLGRELALAYARAGATALALVARNGAALEAVKSEVRQVAPDVRVLAIAADLSQQDEIERTVATALSEFGGRLDVLVNNASALGPTPMPYLLDYPLADLRAVLDTNLVAPFLLIKKVLPAMIERGGSIINVTSDAGQVGYPGWGAYGISKFGLEGMSRTWAAELADTDVRVNLVDPGEMNTQMHRDAEPDEDPTQWTAPTEVTEVFLYLATDESRSVNGKRFQAQEENWGQDETAKAAADDE